jgi:hypothetical protein
VAVIDSGVGPLNDLPGKVVYEQQFIQGNSQDVFGHGTPVAGVIARFWNAGEQKFRKRGPNHRRAAARCEGNSTC